LDEIEWSAASKLRSPVPRDERLLRIYERLSAKPGDRKTVEAWAAGEGLSSRTLSRLTHKKLVVTFRYWCHQIRALAAIARLAQGEPVTTIAFELGYETPRAFSEMFRKVPGILPSRYFA
jgi:AraC-like DNA-binding protein